MQANSGGVATVAPTQADRVGFWLRMARESAPRDDGRGVGYTQPELAERIGLSTKSVSTVVSWEKGVRVPPLDAIVRLARLYGLPTVVFTEPEPTAYERLDEFRRVVRERGQQDTMSGLETEIRENLYPPRERQAQEGRSAPPTPISVDELQNLAEKLDAVYTAISEIAEAVPRSVEDRLSDNARRVARALRAAAAAG